MAGELPEHYFRIRDNGATVFRVDTENRQRRIEMDQIATVNVRNGEIKAHGDRTLSGADLAAIGRLIHARCPHTLGWLQRHERATTVLAASPLAATLSQPTKQNLTCPVFISEEAMLSQIRVTSTPALCSSQEVRRAPCSSGRVSSAKT